MDDIASKAACTSQMQFEARAKPDLFLLEGAMSMAPASEASSRPSSHMSFSPVRKGLYVAAMIKVGAQRSALQEKSKDERKNTVLLE